MDSIVDSQIAQYLKNELHCDPMQVGSAIAQIRSLAKMAGLGVDRQIASAGLRAGPEARIAAAIVGLATGDTSSGISIYAIKQQIETWAEKHPGAAHW